ncbi:MAG: ABC transporter ATP-binding protein [Candidatus Hodarchaeales archaeon]|jgi:ABC-2 type transport system ATP-binding protein
MIYAENLTKVFDNQIVAVNELNLKIPTGEIFGLLGPNGAGKTTTVRLLSCILEPTQGEAVVADLSIRDDSEKIRSIIGLLSETPSLYERLSAKKNLEVMGRLYGTPREQVHKRINELAQQFDFEQYLDRIAGKLSKGNKHKIAIARTMIHEPKVLFFDEPTSSLDPEVAQVVRETIETLTTSYECTVLVCTHNLHEAERLCNRVGIIHHGDLVSVGTPQKLSEDQSPYSTIEIKFLEIPGTISELFNEFSEIKELQIDSSKSQINFKVQNPHKLIPDLIKEIVQKDGRILAVSQKKKTLEDIYFEVVGRRLN